MFRRRRVKRPARPGRSVAALALPICLAATIWPPTVFAQRQSQPDLLFPREAKELSFFSPLGMGIWRPKGDGPYPALIIVHTCAGLKPHIRYWRKEALRRGYVTFVIDSFSSRGVSSNCGSEGPVSFVRGVKDLFDAADHLRALPSIDKSKIAVIGMSWGRAT